MLYLRNDRMIDSLRAGPAAHVRYVGFAHMGGGMKKLVMTIALGSAVVTMAACKKAETAGDNAAANVADMNAADMAADANAMGESNMGSAAPIDNAANAADAMATNAMTNEADNAH